MEKETTTEWVSHCCYDQLMYDGVQFSLCRNCGDMAERIDLNEE